ncbi:glutathione S-transferase family protein [Massilia sp. Leaf139]|uniref:glutathione S-transferase family protein n=1 Tax=Massilia sp. Leaf139 TaxID=1736272 RepID=UPI0006FF85AB|nr:glutathione S-transferase N-terminal domain-containing protein [Massilia sp. Leaf139]KQQ96296.1 glutathione S-transferase [Massilia sp. Leaf139]
MLRIIGKPTSINVRKVLWTCVELDLPFAREDWNEAHAPLNPNRMVPVLVDGDFVLWESNTICRYLCARAQEQALLPAGAQQRARVEQWMDWQATELNNAWRYAFMALVRASPAHADPAQIAAGVANWNRHVGILDAQLAATGAYVAGERFTLADVVIGLSLNRWSMTPMERPDYPHVAAYLQRLAARPGYRAWCANGVP